MIKLICGDSPEFLCLTHLNRPNRNVKGALIPRKGVGAHNRADALIRLNTVNTL